MELLHRARQAGYTGGKSALYALAQTLRTHVVTPLVRFEGLPGEFSQHDFGEVRVRYQDGTEEIVHFFASRLKYSRWAEVTLVPDEQVESLVRTLVDHLAAFGGVPLVAVFDRPEDGGAAVGARWRRHRVESDVCRRRPRSRPRRRSVLAVSAARERQRRESGRLGEGLVLQATALSGSRWIWRSSCASGSPRPTPSDPSRATGVPPADADRARSARGCGR